MRAIPFCVIDNLSPTSCSNVKIVFNGRRSYRALITGTFLAIASTASDCILLFPSPRFSPSRHFHPTFCFDGPSRDYFDIPEHTSRFLFSLFHWLIFPSNFRISVSVCGKYHRFRKMLKGSVWRTEISARIILRCWNEKIGRKRPDAENDVR